MKNHFYLISCLALMVSAAMILMGCDSSDNNTDGILEKGETDYAGIIIAVPASEDSVYLLVTNVKESETADSYYKNSILKAHKSVFAKNKCTVGIAIEFNLVDCAINITNGFPPLGGMDKYYSCHLSNVKLVTGSSYTPTAESISSIVGKWNMESFTQGFGRGGLFNEGELTISFNDNGTLEASFMRDNHLFKNYGIYQCSPEEHVVSINGMSYYYTISGETMNLDGGAAYDGSTFTLKKSK